MGIANTHPRDCEGPRDAGSATTPAAAETTHDEDAPVTGSADPGPSPTASIGCEPHGDHWDCDGPAPTAPETSAAVTQATSAAADTSSAAVAEFTGAANLLSLDYPIAAAAAGVLGVGVFFAAV